MQKTYDFMKYFTSSTEQIASYFKSMKIKTNSQKKSDFYAYQKYINVTEEIFNGNIQINFQQHNIDYLLIKQRISQEQQKQKQLKLRRNQIIHQLALLQGQTSKIVNGKNKSLSKIQIRNQYSQSLNLNKNINSKVNNEEQQMQNTNSDKNKIGKLVLTKKQHKQIINKLTQQRYQRQKNKRIMRQKQQQKIKKLEEQQHINEFQKIQQEKRKKISEIQQKLRKKREQHEKFLEQQKQSQRKYKQIKNKKPLHEQIQQKYEKSIKMPLLQQKKKILRDKRQFAKAYSIDEIKSHEKNYLQVREESLKKSELRQKQKNIQAYKAPLKSSKLASILQEQKLEQRKKLLQKKMLMDDKIHRQENYIEYLKQNFSTVKVDKAKQDQIKIRLQKIHKKRQAEIDSKMLGMGYLQQAKRKRRRTAKQSDEISKQQNSLDLSMNVAMLTDKQNKQKSTKNSRISEEQRKNKLLRKRQQKIQILIQDNSTHENERIQKLIAESDHINQAFKKKEQMLKYGYSQKIQNQAVELLLTNIQAKMGIIGLSKDGR